MKNRNGKESGLEDDEKTISRWWSWEHSRYYSNCDLFSPKTRAAGTHWHIFIIEFDKQTSRSALAFQHRILFCFTSTFRFLCFQLFFSAFCYHDCMAIEKLLIRNPRESRGLWLSRNSCGDRNKATIQIPSGTFFSPPHNFFERCGNIFFSSNERRAYVIATASW